MRVSLFVDPEPARDSLGRGRWAPIASSSTPSRSRARSSAARPPRPASFAKYVAAAELAHELGLGVNAGHDLDLRNLTLFQTLPHLDEVSIGHALISRALFVGLGRVVKEYLAALSARCCCSTRAGVACRREAAGTPRQPFRRRTA